MVALATYTPQRGDAIWLDFDPQLGREQSGRRPAVVLSPGYYNQRSHLALVCPITSRVKQYPFEVPIPAGLPVSGVILADQLRSLDWIERQAAFICRLPEATWVSAFRRLRVLLPPEGSAT